MKKNYITLFSIIILTIFCYSTYSFDIDDCLYFDNDYYFNPDSVLIDTCSQSPTYGKWYSKKGFTFGMNVYVFGEDTLSLDTTVTWENISSSYTQIKNGFQSLEQKFGEYIIKRSDNAPSDSIFFKYPVFDIEFNEYFEVDTVCNEINKIDSNSTGAARLKNEPGIVNVEENENNKENQNIVVIPIDNIYYKIIFNEDKNKMNFEKIRIYNLKGNCVKEINYNQEDDLIIDISTWSKGIYIISIGKYSKLLIK